MVSRWASLLLVVLVTFASVGAIPETSKGKQCPTARVQSIVVCRDCCGHLVTRVPRPGDKGFVQCRCAEKRSAEQKATSPQRADFFFAPAAEVETRMVSVKPTQNTPYRADEPAAHRRPKDHPPRAA